ncbi:MAG: hypothetical protein ABI867_11355 [Kofleriaceae bacterium]
MKYALILLVACSHPPRSQPKPEPALAALPKATAVSTTKFAGVVVCDRCHTAGATAMRAKDGSDISPVTEVLASMMGLSARDPYYLAALRREIAANPGAKLAIEATCNRCHAVVGFAEAGAISLDDLTSGTSPAAVLAREGVGCAGCHALSPEGLGEERSFTGAQALRTDRVSFGLLPSPLEEAMVQMANTRPVRSPHTGESILCASCHTVLVHRLDAKGAPIGDEVPEQTTFLEWRASSFATTKTCQSCHMPATEDELGAGPAITTAFATRPPETPARAGYRRHALRGGNAYLLRRLADHLGWLSAATKPELLRASADATERFLGSAAELIVAPASGGVTVIVKNRTGHKLPTGFPTRRMWLHLEARDAAGKVVFESGAHRDGAIVDAAGKRIDGPGVIEPHRSVIDAAGQVVIWEAVPVDDRGQRTHLLLQTARLVKDDRILPAGWSSAHRDAARTHPIGVSDPDFIAGQDTVTVKLPAAARSITAELLYQPIPPETIESYAPADSREAATFRTITAAPPVPSVLVRAALTR